MQLRRLPLRIALLYALFGGLWILLSDRALQVAAPDLAAFAHWQTYKGWAFVTASAVLIFALLRRDVTNQQRTEDALRASMSRYRGLFEDSPIALREEDWSPVRARFAAWRAAGIADLREHLEANPDEVRACAGLVVVRRVNAAAVRVYGARDGAELMRELYRRMTESALGAFRERLVALGEGRTTFDQVAPIAAMDGAEKLAEIRMVVCPDCRESLERVLVSAVDITARRRAEAELAHAGRLITVGELSASIVHQMSQPMAAILLNAQTTLRLLAAQPPDLDEARQGVREIEAASLRARSVIDALRGFMRRREPRDEPLDGNGCVAEALELVRHEATRRGVVMEAELARGLPRPRGDGVQVQQVVLNLLMNAIEAASEAPSGARRVRARTMRQGDSLVISVRDTGPGLAQGPPDLLFEPFHTTKPEGLGIGLAISRSIVERHGGRIWADAAPGGGAVFSFSLPAAAEVAS